MTKVFYTNGNLLDVVNKRVLHGSVLTEDGEIREVGENLKCPEEAETVDFHNGYVSPGLFNCHTHICLDCSPNSAVGATQAQTTIMALNHCKQLLKAGVTFIRDVGAPDYIDVDVRNAQRKGAIEAPEMQVSGKIIVMTGGHGWQNGRECDGPDECRKAAREQVRADTDWIKVMATGGVMSKGDKPGSTQLTEEELRAAISAAHDAGIPSATHAQGMEGIKNALRAGVDTIEHGFFLDALCFDWMKEHNVFLDPTLSAMYWIQVNGTKAGIPDWAVQKVERTSVAHKKSVLNAYKAGVKITLGTDAGTPFNEFDQTAYEMVLLHEMGLDSWTCLQAGTITAAELCRVQKTHGSLEPGKVASFTVYRDNPLDDMNNVMDCTMTVVKGKTLHTVF